MQCMYGYVQRCSLARFVCEMKHLPKSVFFKIRLIFHNWEHNYSCISTSVIFYCPNWQMDLAQNLLMAAFANSNICPVIKMLALGWLEEYLIGKKQQPCASFEKHNVCQIPGTPCPFSSIREKISIPDGTNGCPV